MAVQTITATAYSRPPKRLHAGNNVVTWKIDQGSSSFGTVGDRVMLAKIARGARIYQTRGNFKSNADVGTAIQLFVGSSPLTNTASNSQSGGGATSFFQSIGSVFHVSMSDGAQPAYQNLYAEVLSGSATTSFVLSGFCEFVFDSE